MIEAMKDVFLFLVLATGSLLALASFLLVLALSMAVGAGFFSTLLHYVRRGRRNYGRV